VIKALMTMRHILWLALWPAVCFPFRSAATNHLLRQDELMAGLNGDATIQFLQITVAGGDQKAWGPNGSTASRAMLVFFNGAGVETGRFFFPSNAPLGANTVLIATTNFASLPGAPTPDFLIPPLITPGSGKVCFRGNPANRQAFDVNLCLSYGSFPSGQTEGAGPPAPALPITGEPQSLKRFQNFAFGQGASFNGDFALGTPAPVNTRGQTLRFPVDGPEIDLLPPNLSFGVRNLNDGPTAPQTLIITNHGTLNPLIITNVTLAGTNANQFRIVSDTGQTNLPPAGRRTITLAFDPDTAGSKTAIVRVDSNDPNELVLDARLTGTGFDPNAPNIVVLALRPIDFRNQNVSSGPSVQQEVRIINQGTIGSLVISNMFLLGADAGQFEIVGSTNGSTVPPGALRTLAVRFDPDSAGRKSAVLRIVSNDPDEGVLDLELLGAGFDLDPCVATGPTNIFAQDDCVNAQLICPGVMFTDTIAFATFDGSSVCGTVPDLWYRYLPARGGTVVVSMLGIGLLPVISAHRGCPGGQSNEIACDTGALRGSTNATITFEVGAEMEILLRVGGFPLSDVRFQLILDGPPCVNADRNQNGVSDICEFDFGDAPAPYPSTLAVNGARHRRAGELILGKRIDGDADGQPSALATGDNLDGQANDEDGVALLTPLVRGGMASPKVLASTNGFLQAWIDFNGDGDWTDDGEQIFINRSLVAGANVLSFAVPPGAIVTNRTFARFRFSSLAGLGFDGETFDGEVEDYAVEIVGGPPTPGQLAVRINEVMAGLNGDSRVQFVEIETDGDASKAWGPQGTEIAGRAMLLFFNEAGVQSGRFVFPGNAPSGGNTVLVATRAFAEASGVAPDFIMPPELWPIAGKVVFRSNPDNEHFEIQLALSYGGGRYFGSTDGGGPANASELPIMHARSLNRAREVTFGLNDNSAFELATPTPRNTAGQTFLFSAASIGEQGRTLFNRETFRGNGRTCGTCHVEGKDQFGLTSLTIVELPEDDPLFVFAPNVNMLRLVARSQPGDLRGEVSGTTGTGQILGGSGHTYFVIGGTNLTGTVTDTNGNGGLVQSVGAGDLNGPTASNGSARGLEDHELLEHGRGLILENIDGFTRGEVFRASPHLLDLAFTAPFGLSGEFDNLEDFSEGAVIQHFPRSLGRVSGVDFRHPTREELEAMTGFMLGISKPATNALNLDRLATTEAQKRGRAMFFGDEGRCSKCHSGPVLALSDGSLFGSLKDVNENFNTGVANILRNLPLVDNLPTEPAGLTPGQSTREFNTPSLFNIRLTAPFFHDGSAATLTEAVKFYDSEEFHNSPAGQEVGSLLAANKAERIADMVAFLESLVELPVDFPRELPFGVHCPGDAPRTALTVAITNISLHTVLITNVAINGPDLTAFEIESDTGQTNLAPGQTRALVIHFSPTNMGLKAATLEFDAIDTNLLGHFTFGVALSGADLDSVVEAVPTALDFGMRDIDAPPSPEDSIVITNSGSIPLEFSMEFVGSDTNNFILIADTTPIEPHSTRIMQVAFAPQTQGRKSALIRLRLLSCNTTLLEIPLAGIATSSVVEFVWDTIGGTQFVGSPFPVRITARDRNGDIVPAFRGVVQLTALFGEDLSQIFRLTPTNAGPFVNGVWNGSVAVHEASSSVALFAASTLGQGGLSLPFAVALRDDLKLDVTAPFSNGGELIDYTLGVHNSGPADATNVVITNLLSPGVAFVSAQTSHGTVSHADGNVLCSLGNLGGGLTAFVTITVEPNLPTNSIVITNIAFVVRNGSEAVLSNNMATNTTVINSFGILTVTPTNHFSSVGLSGGPFSPLTRVYTIHNSGTGPLNWQARAGGCNIPAGLVGWWPLDGHAFDIAGTNAGTLPGGAGFTNGVVGSGMLFDGVDDVVRIAASPTLDVGNSSGLTIETWINPFDISQQRPVVEWTDGAHFWISVPIGLPTGGPGSIFANLIDVFGNAHRIASPPNLLIPNTGQHIAVTYNRTTGDAILFRNGVAVSQQNLGLFRPQTSRDLLLGHRPGLTSFRGVIDEVSIYNRVLSPSEIQSIVAAGNLGKCIGASPTAAHCPLPPNLAGWWPFDGNTADISGGNSGFFFGDPNFTPGFIGQALFFDGSDEAVRIPVSPALDFGQQPGMTFEAWVNVADITRRNPVFEFDNGTSIAGPFIFISANVPGSLHADLTDTANVPHVMISSGNLFGANIWAHIALTYNKSDGRTTLYVNGASVRQQILGSFTLRTTGDIFIGRRGAIGAEESFVGMIDEPTFYGRELTAAEIQSVFLAGASGKCRTQSWLGLSPPGGTLLPGGDATVTVSINTNANRLVVGNYSDTVVFTNLGNGRGKAERLGTLTVINRAPTLQTLPPLQILEDSPLRTVNLVGISAGAGEIQGIMVSAVSSNPAVIPNPIVVNYISPSNAGTLRFMPATNAHGTSFVSVIVRDDGGTANNARDATTNTFRVTVLPVNDVPTLAPVPDLIVAENTLVMITNSASDVDLPEDMLTFSLLGAPPGSTIDPSSGVLSWTPSEAQGPSTNRIAVVVRDAGSPSLSATNQVSVTVLEVNSPPILSMIGDRMVHAGARLNFTILATDPDVPPNQLTYSLESNPFAADLNPITGVFSWLAQVGQIPTTNVAKAIVTDDGVPPLQASETFNVVVIALPRIESVSLSGTNLVIRWTAIPGTRYRVEFNNALDPEGWGDSPGEVVAAETFAVKEAPVEAAGRRFFRVRVRP
jgi:uncharacterized repeat protein (TIGR01451 family)